LGEYFSALRALDLKVKIMRTVHVSTIANGIGDFIHFKNWFEEYSKIKDISEASVVLFYREMFHDKNEINGLINALPDSHPLKSHNKILVQKEPSSSFPNTFCNDIKTIVDNHTPPTGDNSPICLYVISYVKDSHLINLQNYSISDDPTSNLKYCFISEFIFRNDFEGFFVSLRKNNLIKNQAICGDQALMSHENRFYSLGIGKPNRHFCGCFLQDFGPRQNLKDILEKISYDLRGKLFHGNIEKLTIKEMVDSFNQVSIIVCYYQKDREMEILKKIIERKIQSQEAPLLFITGTDIAIDEIEELKIKFNGLRVTYGKLSEKDLLDLHQILRTDVRHFYVSSGDNTIQTSISLGKPIFFTLEKTQDKHRKLSYLNEFGAFLEDLLKQESSQISKNHIAELANFYLSQEKIVNTSGNVDVVSIPTYASLKYFEEVLSEYLIDNFKAEEHLKKIIDGFERDDPIKYEIRVKDLSKYDNTIIPYSVRQFMKFRSQNKRSSLITQVMEKQKLKKKSMDKPKRLPNKKPKF
jgi:hypothetical protein